MTAHRKFKFSIVTPNYNYARFLPETIESVLDQEGVDVEHIIVDDGSTDNSIGIIQHYRNAHPNKIKLIVKSNEGHTPTVNTGFKLATGDIIGWLNSDDTFCPNILRTVLEEFEHDQTLEIVYGNWNLIDKKGKKIFYFRHLPFSYRAGVFIGFEVLTSNATFWRRSIFDRFGMLDESFKYNPDGDYFSRITVGTKMRQLNIPLANHRSHDESSTMDKNVNVLERKQIELQRVFYRSYDLLPVARFVPKRYASVFKYLYRMKRIVSRFVRGHYFPFQQYLQFRALR